MPVDVAANLHLILQRTSLAKSLTGIALAIVSVWHELCAHLNPPESLVRPRLPFGSVDTTTSSGRMLNLPLTMPPDPTVPISFQPTQPCAACMDLLRVYYDGEDAGVVAHHESFQSLAQAAASECYICSIVVSNIQSSCGKTFASVKLHPRFVTTASIHVKNDEEPLLKLDIYPPPFLDRCTVIKFRLIISPGESVLKLESRHDSHYSDYVAHMMYAESTQNLLSSAKLDWLGDNTSSSGTMDLAREWYTTCCANHTTCRLPFNERKDWQPTRLIDVGLIGEDSWRLCESPIVGWPVEYMTLSYRWNLEPGMRLLDHNICDFLKGLPDSALPQTFRDAVMVARQFSVRYLWVDALCIIQDSPDDWNREAFTMRYIYSHSVCNIAASVALDQYSGLFSDRSLKQSLPGAFRLSQDFSNAVNSQILVFDKDYWNRQLAHGPLHNRGWVFQECLLAPRILYFARDQILWECFQGNKCEGFLSGIPYNLRGKDLTALWSSLRSSVPSEGMTLPIHGLWTDIVERYTLCNLTYHKDKLPALAGVAQVFADATGDEYADGLWLSKMVEQLLWHVVNPSEPVTRPRAPSWSWASVRGRVRTRGLSSPRVNLVSLIRIVRQDVSRERSEQNGSKALHLKGAVYMLGPATPQHYKYNSLGSANLDAICYNDTLAVGLEKVENGLYFVPALSDHPWYPPRERTTRIAGLLLTLVGCQSTGEFKRIGLFATESSRDIERFGFEITDRGLAAPKASCSRSEIMVL